MNRVGEMVGEAVEEGGNAEVCESFEVEEGGVCVSDWGFAGDGYDGYVCWDFRVICGVFGWCGCDLVGRLFGKQRSECIERWRKGSTDFERCARTSTIDPQQQ